MISYSELKPGVIFVDGGEPWIVLEYDFLRKQQRKPVVRTKVRNLKNGKVLDKTYHFGDQFEEAEIERKKVKYLYNNKGEFWFAELHDPSKRFSLEETLVGNQGKFLKGNTEISALAFDEKIIGVEMPVKVELKVKEAPPAIKGNTAQGGTKPIVLETNATINAPLFVSTGDVVRVNTQTGEYAERVEKASEF